MSIFLDSSSSPPRKKQKTLSMDPAFVDLVEPESHNYDYDLIVIGGGSGGLACAQEAAKYGVKVAVFDFVKPSPQGTTWGLGGTCVNVGCIPKKLMHTAAILGESLKESESYGWEPRENKNNWTELVSNVVGHIKSLNWGYRTALRSVNVEYINALASFIDSHNVKAVYKNGSEKTFSARRFVIAVGGRPVYPDIPGMKEYAITSDDIFYKQEAPGKTLVVGASYVALECAGFLTGLGFDTTVIARSILLRGFDQKMAEMIGDYMANHGTRFVRPAVPVKIEKVDEKLEVTYKKDGEAGEVKEQFDTVLVATGRRPETDKLGLDAAGVAVLPNGKLETVHERTNIPHIYAIGDVLQGQLELTPVAIKAGRLLAQRLFEYSKRTMDYQNVPTTVFTPLEYGSCGFSEEEADAKLGEENVEVYMTYYKPTEWTVPHKPDNTCFMKLICDKTKDEKVIGFHVLGDHAGEITQGVAIAIKAGATKAIFDDTVGIHPTSAETMTTLTIARSSGESATQKGC